MITLRDEFDIRILRGGAFVVRRSDGQHIAAVTAAEAVVLALLDGRRTVRSVKTAFTAWHGRRGASVVRHVLSRLAPLLADRGRRRPAFDLRALASVAPPPPSAPSLPGPRVLHWWVTRYCPRACAYCFTWRRRGSRALDAALSRERMRELLLESADLGARSLLLSGGEPLLRADLPEIMGDAVRAGIEPSLATKARIDSALAARLARAGVRHVVLSLDTLDARVNAWLVSDGEHAKWVCRSARNLTGAGVRFSIQAVVTKRTAPGLDALARRVADLGANQLHLVPCETWTGAPAGRATAADPIAADAIERASSCDAGLPVTVFRPPQDGLDARRCDIGRTKLFFLPEGVVHRCHRLVHRADLVGPDLRRVSVAAAWHCAALRHLVGRGAGSKSDGDGCMYVATPVRRAH